MSMRNPNGFIRPGYDPLKVADAPTAVTPAPGNTVASVDFTPPSNVGGAAVSEYYAVVNPGNITATSVTPPVAVTGLTNGVEYTTKVWANNSYGPSPYSAESSGFVPQIFNYVEDVFSTYLYTGNGTSQTITNGIDLDGEGGLVWIKRRNGVGDHTITDTIRGPGKELYTNQTWDQQNYTGTYGVSAFNSTGFSLVGNNGPTNGVSGTYASWTFRKAPKFFDVVTYTGTGSVQNISHNLGSVPGCVIVKSTSNTGGWSVYHRGLYPPAATAGTTAPENYVLLNSTAQVSSLSTVWNNTSPTSTQFTVGTNAAVNTSGQSYVAYIFAHNAGGFGESDEENVITCGQYQGLGDGTGPVIDLGFEPQWLLVKAVKDSSSSPNWYVIDNMRSWTADGSVKDLSPNTSTTETSSGSIKLTATGFQPMGNDGSIYNERLVGYIYIAIRRGPMKTPESGTEVFSPVARSGTGATATVTNNITTDLIISQVRNTSGTATGVWDRLRGFPFYLETTGTAAESASSDSVTAMNNTAYVLGADSGTDRINRSGYTYANWTFSRAPGFFDVVAYTGTGVAHTEVHNLGVAPEMMIVKTRSTAENWIVYHSALTATSYRYLNSSSSSGTTIIAWNNTEPTATDFTVGVWNNVNGSGVTNIAYLFATLAGVSKVSSYTGTGADVNVDCGFSAGARFVLIRRTDSTGDWYVWDSARGIVSGNDPYLLLNSTAAEVTSTDYVDTLASGFTVTASAPAALNASGGSYIFLAIA